MKSAPAIVIAAAAASAAPGPAHAADLTVVNVSAPAINCVFNASCTVVVTDSVGTLEYTPLGSGAFLQSRTYPGASGAPGAGTTAYEYRVDLTQATGYTECLAGVVVNFGPVVQLTYPPNQPAQVYVITQGGLGSVGIQSAEHRTATSSLSRSAATCAPDSPATFSAWRRRTRRSRRPRRCSGSAVRPSCRPTPARRSMSRRRRKTCVCNPIEARRSDSRQRPLTRFARIRSQIDISPEAQQRLPGSHLGLGGGARRGGGGGGGARRGGGLAVRGGGGGG